MGIRAVGELSRQKNRSYNVRNSVPDRLDLFICPVVKLCKFFGKTWRSAWRRTQHLLTSIPALVSLGEPFPFSGTSSAFCLPFSVFWIALLERSPAPQTKWWFHPGTIRASSVMDRSRIPLASPTRGERQLVGLSSPSFQYPI